MTLVFARARRRGDSLAAASGLIVASLAATSLFAQADPKPAPPAPAAASPQDNDLQAAVELCFSITEDAKAETKIAEVAASCAADPAQLLRAITTPPPPHPAGEAFEMRIPFQGIPYAVKVAPPKKDGDPSPPVVLDLSWSSVSSSLHLEAPILCGVERYTPDEFSDAGRDSFRKFLHTVSFTLGGDPDRFWLTGFSWAGHAGFDVAEHRPGLLRGFVSLAGGPRRNHFRLLQNLGANTRVVACVGAKDDAELVWNLKELARLAPSQHLDLHFTLDPEAGHKPQLKGIDGVAELIGAAPSSPPSLPRSGALLADGDHVALPWLELVEVDPAAVKVPDRFAANAALSPDDQRRAMIHSMADKIARVDWKVTTTKSGALALALTSKAVKRAALFVKAPWFDPSQELQVTANGKKVFEGRIAPDPATLLHEARRTGDRQRPTLMRIEVSFGS